MVLPFVCVVASKRPPLVTTTFSTFQGGCVGEHDHYFVLYNKRPTTTCKSSKVEKMSAKITFLSSECPTILA